jgi:hypothetical protein
MKKMLRCSGTNFGNRRPEQLAATTPIRYGGWHGAVCLTLGGRTSGFGRVGAPSLEALIVRRRGFRVSLSGAIPRSKSQTPCRTKARPASIGLPLGFHWASGGLLLGISMAGLALPGPRGSDPLLPRARSGPPTQGRLREVPSISSGTGPVRALFQRLTTPAGKHWPIVMQGSMLCCILRN